MVEENFLSFLFLCYREKFIVFKWNLQYSKKGYGYKFMKMYI